MNVRNKSIEELLDLEEELLEAKDNEQDGSFQQLIKLYEELYKRISRDRENEYWASLENIKKKLVSYLVRYGSYIKTHYQKDDRAAERNLKKATVYQKELPIAYYRLGFLSYKLNQYAEASQYFQKAKSYQKVCKEPEYRLNPQQ